MDQEQNDKTKGSQPSSYKTWAKDDMQRAVEAVVNDKMSICKASKNHDVPRSTLSDIVNGKTSIETQMGRPTLLSQIEEDALIRYISYMADNRYPVTRTQVISLAWAIALQHGKNSFLETGPSMKWWRCFKKRHPDLRLRTPETVDRGRVTNATTGIIDDYFKILEDTLNENGLADKPHRIYNCDEAGISLNRSTQKVLVPVKNKRCHSLMKGTGSHISVLCCISAAGTNVPPLIIFKNGLPAGRSYVEEGPPNATYASSESGFIDRDIYTEWFEKNFLKFASHERPLILLQDGASAHFSPRLIDLAISNNTILLSFPPKLTPILQPCDVGVYRKMKAELSKTMHQVKMLRGDVWVSKHNFPAVFREVFEKTMCPAILTNSFRKCGIYPLNKDVIMDEMVSSGYTKSLASTSTAHGSTMEMSSEQKDDTCIADISLEVVDTSNLSDVEGQVLLTHDNSNSDVQACPPELALQAIETSLTPKKKRQYDERYKTANEKHHHNDPVFSTWMYLKQKIDGSVTSKLIPLNSDDNPLVRAGVVPATLANVLSPPTSTHRIRKRGSKKSTTRVLTGDDIQKEIAEKEKKKKDTEEAKLRRQQVKSVKNVKQTKPKRIKLDFSQEITGMSNANNDLTRKAFFSSCLQKLSNSPSFKELLTNCESLQGDIRNYECRFPLPTTSKLALDEVSLQLFQDTEPTLKPVKTMADGNCLPRTASFLLFGNEANHVEMRVRIVMEMVLHASDYLTDSFLAKGTISRSKSVSTCYAMFSMMFSSGKLPKSKVRAIFEKEALNSAQINSYMGPWQLHALSSVLGVRLQVYYLGQGAVKHDLNRLIHPRDLRWDSTLSIMWTHTTNANRSTWWEPNHFVPLFPTEAVEDLKQIELPVTVKFDSAKPVSLNRKKKTDSSPCTACGWHYGDPKDPLKCEAWSMCGICEQWYHASCAEDHGILEEDDTFTCQKCFK